MKRFNETIHQPTRLRVMAALAVLGRGVSISFVELRDLVGSTDGNLGAHLDKLAAEGYIEVRKHFVARKPRTDVRLTAAGLAAYEGHVAALKGILEEGSGGGTVR